MKTFRPDTFRFFRINSPFSFLFFLTLSFCFSSLIIIRIMPIVLIIIIFHIFLYPVGLFKHAEEFSSHRLDTLKRKEKKKSDDSLKKKRKKKRKRSIDWYNEAAANQKFIVDEDIKKKCCVLYRSDANVLYTSRSEPLIMAFSAHDSDSLCCLPWSKPRVCNSLTYKPVDPGGWASENNIKKKEKKSKK